MDFGIGWVRYASRARWVQGGGAGVVVIDPRGVSTPYAVKLAFPVIINEGGYEALILGLRMAKNLGAKEVIVKGDSKMVIGQMGGDFALKEISLAPYRAIVQEEKRFFSVIYQHIPRSSNRFADALATLATKLH